jgi:DNA-binding Lrp family transcriptional regulator
MPSSIEVLMPKKVSTPKKVSKPKKGSKLKKVCNAPSNGFSALQESALELIGSKSDGVYQSELRKQLGIDSAKCSKVVSRLERAGLINREPADYGSRRTYLIRLNSVPQLDDVPQLSDVPQLGDDSQLGNDSQLTNDSQPCNLTWPSNAPPIKDTPLRNIDTYLTEFYLLYLIRGSTSA